jgi:hypothetical protein
VQPEIAVPVRDLLPPLVGTSLYAFSPDLTAVCRLAAGVAAAAGRYLLLGAIGRRSGKMRT